MALAFRTPAWSHCRIVQGSCQLRAICSRVVDVSGVCTPVLLVAGKANEVWAWEGMNRVPYLTCVRITTSYGLMPTRALCRQGERMVGAPASGSPSSCHGGHVEVKERCAGAKQRNMQHSQQWLPDCSHSLLATEACSWSSNLVGAAASSGGGGGGGEVGKRFGADSPIEVRARGLHADQLCGRGVLLERGTKQMIRRSSHTSRAKDGSRIGGWSQVPDLVPYRNREVDDAGPWVAGDFRKRDVVRGSLYTAKGGGGQPMAIPSQQDGMHGETETVQSGNGAKGKSSRRRAFLSVQLTMEQAVKEALDEHSILKHRKRLGNRRERLLARREELMQAASETHPLAESDGCIGIRRPFSTLSVGRQQYSRSSLSTTDSSGKDGGDELQGKTDVVPKHSPIIVKKPVLPSRWDGPGGCVILMDKPKDWTSFGVCARVRSLVKVQKVGHAGTLDPMATGLLILCIGKATKLADSYQALQKTYTGTIRLGEATSSYDAETDVIEQLPWEHISDEDIRSVAQRFIGNIMQVPPIFSALKMRGERLYEKGRRGETVDIPPRPVVVYNFELLRSKSNRQHVDFKVECSKGTYVRSLANDLGHSLGSCGHLIALRREKIGDFSVKSAWTVDEFMKAQN